MVSKKLGKIVYIEKYQDKALRKLSKKTKIPVTQYVRDGIDLILEKYSKEVAAQLKKQALLQ